MGSSREKPVSEELPERLRVSPPEEFVGLAEKLSERFWGQAKAGTESEGWEGMTEKLTEKWRE